LNATSREEMIGGKNSSSRSRRLVQQLVDGSRDTGLTHVGWEAALLSRGYGVENPREKKKRGKTVGEQTGLVFFLRGSTSQR
jgi:hypothetical protein